MRLSCSDSSKGEWVSEWGTSTEGSDQIPPYEGGMIVLPSLIVPALVKFPELTFYGNKTVCWGEKKTSKVKIKDKVLFL